MFKKLSSVLLVGALLTGCAGSAEQSAVEEVEATEEAVEEVTDSSVFVDDIQTTFAIELTETPTITEEEKAIGRELSEHVNHSEEVVSDREHVRNASANYPNHTYEELYDIYIRYYEDIFHGHKGDYYLQGTELLEVQQEVINANMVSNDIISQEGSLDDDGSVVNISGNYKIDGQPARISMWLAIDVSSSEATLLRLQVDDEEALEFNYEDLR